MSYFLRIFDNFHYTDESEAYDHGEYETYEYALIDAKAIVDRFLIHSWKHGITPENLFSQWDDFGEDPAICSDGHYNHVVFSARTYAQTISAEICRKLENKNETQSLYQEVIKFATAKHMERDQRVPGTDLPYVVHLSTVAMEILIAASNSDNFNLGFAVQVALLHDTIEDTYSDLAELENKFGTEIANAVSALTKNTELPKEQQMPDSLTRIKKMPPEVWAVKLADRITNLQPPPSHWNKEKILTYQEEARTILSELKDGNQYLSKRLETAIENYLIFIN